MRKKTQKVYSLILLTGLLYIAWLYFTGIEIQCFYLKTTGLECPGCGITRMFLSMLRLDFASAFNYNPVMFIMFFVWNTIGLLCLWERLKFVSNPKFLYSAMWISLAVMIGYAIIRNC